MKCALIGNAKADAERYVPMRCARGARRVFYREMVGDEQVTHTLFLYNGYLCIRQLFSNAPWNVYKEFIWDPTEPIATRPLCFRQNGQQATFLLHDGNKNVTDVVTVGPHNSPVAHYEYAPFGAATHTGPRATDNPFRFSSEFADDSLGLVYYNYRHYNPTDGRWLGRDPLEEHMKGDNTYVSCENNLLIAFDHLGLQACESGFRHSIELIEFSLIDGLDEPVLPVFTQSLTSYITSTVSDVVEDQVSDFFLDRSAPEMADVVRRILNQAAINKRFLTAQQWICKVVIRANLTMRWISCCGNDSEEKKRIEISESVFIHKYDRSNYVKIDPIIEMFTEEVDGYIDDFEGRIEE